MDVVSVPPLTTGWEKRKQSLDALFLSSFFLIFFFFLWEETKPAITHASKEGEGLAKYGQHAPAAAFHTLEKYRCSIPTEGGGALLLLFTANARRGDHPFIVMM